ncbi:MAG: sensor domain-containing diguanylate cyclase [candidate division Zixibacteria bacterium]|nr:sensor domain-containing diguanylate cyclase [candidate division Zixibacteria bacterium]
MKLFLGRPKTLLPQIDSIYLITRFMVLLGFCWLAFFWQARPIGDMLVYTIIGTYAMHLAIFYGATKDKFDLKLAYLSSIIYDLIFIPVYILFTGGVDSSLYLLFYMTVSVAAYILTFWFAILVGALVTVAYLAIVYGEISPEQGFDIVMRIGFLWAFFLTISYVSVYMRRTETRVLKLFDTLNLRTAELEHSQTQLEMIYENTRNLASILDPEAVVKEIMRLMGGTLQYGTYAIVFRNKSEGFYFRARSVDKHENFHPKAIESSQISLISKVAEMQEMIRIKDIRGRTDYVALHPQTRSVIIIPLTSHGRTHGLLVAESPEIDRFRERDQQMLAIVSRSAALALENAELHRRTEELTIIDELTETYNYRYFVRKLEEEKKRAIRYSLPLSIIMVDLDWFKKLNDSYGHEVGNIVLRALSRVIKQCIRDVDIFARYGGEEFVIILPQTPEIEAKQIGERIRAQSELTIIDAGSSGKVKVTVSVGVSSFPENGKSHEELLTIADQALYRAKGSGKNLVCVA